MLKDASHVPGQEYINAAQGVSLAFGPQVRKLTGEQMRLMVLDYWQAHSEDGCTPKEYRRRIGRNNLASYVRCLEVSK